MCLSLEASLAGAAVGYFGATYCFWRNEGCDRGRAVYFLFHGTWQALDALLWYDVDVQGHQCSPLNYQISNFVLPTLICLLVMIQMHMAQVVLFMAGEKLYLTRWDAFKFISASFLCWSVLYGELQTMQCTTILPMPSLISSRILEWCNAEFSYKALAVYIYAAVVGYDDPAEPSKTRALTQSPILFVAVGVVVAQVVFFRSFHLSLFCFFCFGLIVPALFGPRNIRRLSTTCW